MMYGDFSLSFADDAWQVVPTKGVIAAHERWSEWAANGKPGNVAAIGVDVARSGNDKTCMAILRGPAIEDIRYYSHEDTMTTAERVKNIHNMLGGAVVVDVIGVGAGVVDKLRADGIDAIAFNAAERTDQVDSSGELGFTNCRSASWWVMRELLATASGLSIALPPDDILTGDLCAPKYRIVPGGRIQVESKEDIKRRIGRSTDAADAVIMAIVGQSFAMIGRNAARVTYDPVRIGSW
jgi:hypothetical protein